MTTALIGLKVKVRVRVAVRISVLNAVGGTSISIEDSFLVDTAT